MSIAYNSLSFNSNDGTSVSVSHTAAGSDRFALIGAYQGIDWNPTSVSYGGQTPTLIATVGSRLRVWRLTAPATGSQTITVNSDQSGGLVVAAISLTGVHQTTPIGTEQVAENSEQASITSPSIASSATGLIVDFAILIATDIAAGAGQTERLDVDGDNSPPTGHGVGFFSFGVSTKAGTTTTTTTWNTAETFGDNRLIAVPLIESVSSAGVTMEQRKFGPQGFQRTLVNM